MLEDTKLIKDAVHAYFDGITNKNYESFLKSWHEDARMTSAKEGEVSVVPRSFWKEWCEKETPDEKVLSSDILSIDITGSVAVVKVKVVRDTPKMTYNFTDYLTLLKESESKWSIINKSFHADITEK